MTYVSNDPARWPFLSNAHLASYLIVVSSAVVVYDCINIRTRGALHWNTIFCKTSAVRPIENLRNMERGGLVTELHAMRTTDSHEGWVESKDQWCTLDNTYVTATESGYSSFDSPWGLDGQY
ncbi:hypothetical protein EV702DRAFT_1051368 [Suillus placidus]|uniref:Uncharacterized protein n=1 Tax=Suillus placidus TaxID=48579 RepID=A0A9P7CW12_9AGAM|nr:hypothetical protein EV702DRAFT_1051368 [Suillus placidus]